MLAYECLGVSYVGWYHSRHTSHAKDTRGRFADMSAECSWVVEVTWWASDVINKPRNTVGRAWPGGAGQTST